MRQAEKKKMTGFENIVFSFVKNELEKAQEDARTVEKCPYVPGGGCIQIEGLPPKNICGNNECWELGVYVQEYLRQENKWDNILLLTVKDITSATRYARQKITKYRDSI